MIPADQEWGVIEATRSERVGGIPRCAVASLLIFSDVKMIGSEGKERENEGGKR